MSLNAEFSAKITLRMTEDWILWDEQFQSKARRAAIWKYINPNPTPREARTRQSLAEALEPPEKPSLSEFDRSTTPGSSHQTRSTRTIRGIADLTPEETALWSTLLSAYNTDEKEHRNLIKSVTALEDWIRETVSSENLRRCCKASKNLDEWYKELKAHLGIDPIDRKAKARREYDETLAAPARKRLSTKKEVEDWIKRWDNAYVEAIDSGLDYLEKADMWFADATAALSRSYIDTWIFAYSSSHIQRVRENTIKPSEMLADLRYFMSSVAQEPLRGRAKGGAFGPADAEDSPIKKEQDQESQQPNQRGRDKSRGRGNRGRGSRGRYPRDHTPRGDRSNGYTHKRDLSNAEERSNLCDACCGFHPLARCFYINEAIRPERWHADSRITELIKQKMLGDESLADRSTYALKNSAILDSGATVHIFNDLSRFTRLTAAAPGDFLWAGTIPVAIDGYGSVDITVKGADSSPKKLRLHDVVYCEKFAANLVSFTRLRKRGLWWDTSPGNNCLRRSDHSFLCQLEEIHNQQVLEHRRLAEDAAMTVTTELPKNNPAPIPPQRNRYTTHTKRRPIQGDAERWHQRLGHPGPDVIPRLPNAVRGARLTFAERIPMHKCSSCAQGKMKRQVRRAPRESLALASPGDRLAIDLHDFKQGYAGFSSAMMITCRATGYTWDFYLTERTTGVLSPTLDDFFEMLLTQYGIKVKRIETDNELLRHPDITQSLSARGIIVEPSAANTQAQNGGAERIAGVIKTKARCMRIGANFPEALWPEITTCATYLYNRTPAASRGWKSPYELFHSRFRLGECSPLARPDLSHLRSYGCRAYAMTSDAQLGRQRKRKLAPRAWLGFLVGYTSSNSYRVWNPLRNEVFTIRDVVFDEHRHFDGSLPKLAEEIREMDLYDIQQRIDQLIKASENIKITQDADEEGDDIEEHADASTNVQRISSDPSYTKARFKPMPTPPQSPPAAFFTAVGVGGDDEDEGSPLGEESPKERTTHRISWKAAFLAGLRPRRRPDGNPHCWNWPDQPGKTLKGGYYPLGAAALCAAEGSPKREAQESNNLDVGPFASESSLHTAASNNLDVGEHASESLSIRNGSNNLVAMAARSASESSPIKKNWKGSNNLDAGGQNASESSPKKRRSLIGTHWKNLYPLPSYGQLAKHPYRDEFKEAEKSHLQGHKVAGSWEKVPRAHAAGHQILGCHWVYTYKLDKHGRLTK
ncbi:hypothetical protein FALBO_3208, partial [Fusarium albosuccineum]